MNVQQTLSYFLLDMFFPNACLVCEKSVLRSLNSICDTCWENFEQVPLKNRVNYLSLNNGIDIAYSGWYFTKGMDDVIHSLKYSDRAKLGLEFGRHLGQLITLEQFTQVDILTSVPLHNVKYRDRGYNQAEWIGNGIAEVWQIPCRKNVLKRVRFTESQTTLNREERQANMENAFMVTTNVEDKSITIVDDVLTTGSTISACAQVLKRAGARNVYALTLASPMTLES